MNIKSSFVLIFILFAKPCLSQVDYKKLNIELLNQISANHLSRQFPTDKWLVEINEIPDSVQKSFFLKNAKSFLTEVKYGHKPKYLEYKALTENLQIDSLIQAIGQIDSIVSFEKLIKEYEPTHPEYQRLMDFQPIDTLPQLIENLNFYRYLNRFGVKKYIVLNIPSAKLIYYENDKNVLDMNVIVGRFQNQTPRIISYIDEVIVYPYWTPTYSIATKELLPLIKKNIKYLENNSFDVLDSKGNIVNPYSINWSALSTSYFPYRLRQGTGCDNSLGLIKFNINSPYSVYMHDTKHTEASTKLFNKPFRFYSHGCMRLSKPTELANLVLGKKMFDEDFMETCEIQQKTSSIKLEEKMPVFIIYQIQELDSTGKLVNYNNYYKIKNL